MAYLAVENIAGRRVTSVEVEDADRRIVVHDDPQTGLAIEVTNRSGADHKRTRYKSWEALRENDPVASAAYDKQRTVIDTELLTDSGRARGGWGQIGDAPHPPMLGIGFEDTGHGCHVKSLVEDGPAKQAGIQVGDVVRRIGGIEIANFEALVNVVCRFEVGDKIQVVFERDGKAVEVPLTLAPNLDVRGGRLLMRDGGQLIGSIRNGGGK